MFVTRCSLRSSPCSTPMWHATRNVTCAERSRQRIERIHTARHFNRGSSRRPTLTCNKPIERKVPGHLSTLCSRFAERELQDRREPTFPQPVRRAAAMRTAARGSHATAPGCAPRRSRRLRWSRASSRRLRPAARARTNPPPNLPAGASGLLACRRRHRHYAATVGGAPRMVRLSGPS